MKRRIIAVLAAVLTITIAGSAFAAGPKWPDKNWHRGFYITGNVGMMQVTNDKHAVTGKPFNGPIDPSFGLTFGWDVVDWIGPLLQVNFATTTGTAGDARNNNADMTYGNLTFPAGTFTAQSGVREYALDFGLYVRATLPYFTKASWQKDNFKIIPYAKAGGLGHGLFVNASSDNNKIGAYGGGLGFGAGVEFFAWNGFVFSIDATEAIIFQQSVKTTINDTSGTPQRVDILQGGTKMQFNLLGLIGWHF